MTDLEALIAERLRDQAPITTPQVGVLRRRATRRRRRVAVAVAMVATTSGLVAAATFLPLLGGESRATDIATTQTGCAAVLEELETLLAQADGWPPLSEQGVETAAALQLRIGIETERLTDEQERLIEDIRPSINDLMLGDQDSRALELLGQGARDLRINCPGGS